MPLGLKVFGFRVWRLKMPHLASPLFPTFALLISDSLLSVSDFWFLTLTSLGIHPCSADVLERFCGYLAVWSLQCRRWTLHVNSAPEVLPASCYACWRTDSHV